MKRNYIFTVAGVMLASGMMVAVVHAQQPEVKYPVVQLGGCASKEACKVFCEAIVNRDACTAFGKAHNLIKPEDAKRYEDLKTASAQGGPGGCKGSMDCRQYCAVQQHLQECVAFAKKIMVMPAKPVKTMPPLPPRPTIAPAPTAKPVQVVAPQAVPVELPKTPEPIPPAPTQGGAAAPVLPQASLPSGVTPSQLCNEYGGTWTDHCNFDIPPELPPDDPALQQGSAFGIFLRLLGF